VQAVANAIVIPLSANMLGDVPKTLDDTLAADQKSEGRVRWLLVFDPALGKVVASTAGAPSKLEDVDRNLKDGIRSTSSKVVHARSAGSDWVYTTPIELGGTTHGQLYMAVSTAGLEKELTAALEESQARSKATRNRVWLVGALVLAIGIVLVALQGVRLASPIKELTRQANKIAAGDLRSRVPQARRDELGVLARTFNFMADQIQHLLVSQAQKASLEKEMALAREVQQAMLPSEALDEHGSLKVVGYCMPASSCGGDWWTYRKLSNGRMLLVVGDATGHGIHSAMIAATARGAVEALSAIDERLLTPEQVLRAIDSAIRQVGDHNVLMTAFAAVFDSANGILHYANAGQNFPYVIKLGVTRVLEEASIIAASGNPLGDRNIAIEIRRGSLQLRPGDLFVCFTDGVVERANPAGKLFGDRRLRGALTGQKLPDSRALVALRDHLRSTLERYAEGAIAEDDITFVLCQFDPIQARGRGAA
jgi:serine phosphatase RsbU (regulator of sigma subunit)